MLKMTYCIIPYILPIFMYFQGNLHETYNERILFNLRAKVILQKRRWQYKGNNS